MALAMKIQLVGEDMVYRSRMISFCESFRVSEIGKLSDYELYDFLGDKLEELNDIYIDLSEFLEREEA